MKKILIAEELNSLLQQRTSFLNRGDTLILTASTNDELLRIHGEEKADLIITQLDLPGMSTEQMASRIRNDAGLSAVQIILVCANNRAAIEQCSRCKPNAVILQPVNPGLLLARAQKMLDIAWRETYRVRVDVAVEGLAEEHTFFCRTQDVSAAGMLIETEKRLAKGTKITCAFSLPEGAEIRTTGEIVRAKGTGAGGLNQYGVKFLSITPEEGRTLEAFIDNKSARR